VLGIAESKKSAGFYNQVTEQDCLIGRGYLDFTRQDIPKIDYCANQSPEGHDD